MGIASLEACQNRHWDRAASARDARRAHSRRRRVTGLRAGFRTTARSIAGAIVGVVSALSQTAAAPPIITLTNDDTVITQSCIVEIASAIEDANQNGVLHIKADNITVRFKDGSALRGAAAGHALE